MSVEKYYLSESMYAYPSSNANDGGEDNSEYNLKTITDKFAIKSFVIYRTGGVSDNYFIPTYYSGPEGIGFHITGGECSINGYYFTLKDTILITRLTNKETVLKPSTKYNIVLRIYKDGIGHIRGDGTSVVAPTVGKRENRGITLGVYTDEEYNALDHKLTLLLGYFNTDNSGDPPQSPEDYHLDYYRFVWIISKTITTPSGMNIEDWVIYQLDHLNKLQYWEGDTLISQLILDDKDVIIKLPGRPDISITAIEDRTHVAESGKFTTTIENVQSPYNYSVDTYNGTSILLARSDHNHDDKYILKHCNPETWGNTPIIQRLLNSGLAMTGNLVISPNTDITSTPDLTRTGKFEVNSETGAFDASNGNFIVSNTGSTSNNGFLSVGTTTPVGLSKGDIYASKDITAVGDITGNRVFNAVWNDYADAVKRKFDCNPEYGDIISKCKDSNEYEVATWETRKLVVGVYSNTYGHLLGGEKGKTLEENLENYIPIAVAGNVMVKVVGKVKAGDMIVQSGINGVGKAQKLFTKGKVVGKALESKTSNGVGKVLIQVMLR